MAQRSTQRTDPSQPPDDRTYSPEVTSFEQSPGSSQCSAGQIFPFHASFIIILEFPPDVKRKFLIFSDFQRNFRCRPGRRSSGCFGRSLLPPPGGKTRPVLTADGGPALRPALLFRVCFPLSGRRLSRLRPSRCRWCTSSRTQGTRPRCRSAPGACSGR